MSDILRQNYVALIGTMRSQEYICNLLTQHGILTQENKETILCGKTNGEKNRLLVDFVRRRFKKGFKVFCDGLDLTRQHHLLEVLDPDRLTDGGGGGGGGGVGEASTNESGTGTECKICLTLPIRIAFQPCRHACCCETCANQVDECPLCRARIRERLTVYV